MNNGPGGKIQSAWDKGEPIICISLTQHEALMAAAKALDRFRIACGWDTADINPECCENCSRRWDGIKASRALRAAGIDLDDK